MTTPDLSFLRDNNGGSPDQSPGGTPDLSFLAAGEEEPGTLTKSYRYIANLFKAAALSEMYSGGGGVGTALTMRRDMDDLIENPLTPEEYQQALANYQAQPSSVDINKDKIIRFFTTRPNNPLPKIMETLSQIKENPGDFAASLPAGIAEMVFRPLEIGFNADVTADGVTPYTPEQRADAIRNTIGDVVMIAATGGTTALARKKLLGGALTSAEIAEANALKAIATSNPTKLGTLARTITADVTGGAVGGIVQSGIQSAGDPDIIADMLINGVLMAPVGIAFDAVRGNYGPKALRAPIERARLAGELYNLHQIQALTNKSLPEFIGTLENLKSADNVADVIIRNITADDIGFSNPVLLTGISQEKIGELVLKSGYGQPLKTTKGFEIWQRTTTDNLNQVLLVPDYHPLTRESRINHDIFKHYGFVPGEVVIYKGKEHIFDGVITTTDHGVVNRHARLITEVGSPLDFVEFKALQRKSSFDYNPDALFAGREVTIKRNILDKSRGNLVIDNSPFIAELEAKIHRAIQSGGPIDLPLFRQDRGGRIPGTGTFYATTVRHAFLYGQDKSTFHVSRVRIDKPFIVNGGHKRLIDNLDNYFGRTKDENYWNSIHEYLSEARAEWFPEPDDPTFTPSNFLSDERLRYYEFAAPLVEKYGSFKAIPDSEFSNFKDAKIHITEAERKALYSAAKITYEKGSKPYVVHTYNPKRAQPITPQGVHPESGYQLMDKILARVLRRNGFDGIIYDKGFGQTEVVTYNATMKDRTIVKEGKTGFTLGDQLQQKYVLDQHFNEYFNSRFGQGYDATNFDFNKDLWEFADQRGILKSQFNAYRREISSRLAAKIKRDILDPDTVKELNEASNTLRRAETETIQQAKTRSQMLVEAANIANMLVDVHEGGAIALRDTKSGKIIQLFNSVEDAHKFVMDSGIPDAIGLVKGEIPTGITPPPNSGARVADWQFDPDKNGTNFFERIVNGFYSSAFAKYIVPVGEYMKSVDNMLGTDLYTSVFDPTQLGFRKYIAQVDGYRRTIEPLAKKIKGLSRAERELISEYRETRSEAELLKDGVVKGRKLTEAEIKHAQWLSDNNIDIKRVYEYRAERRQLDAWYEKNGGATEQMPDGSMQPKAYYLADLKELKAKYWADDNDINWKAVDLFDEIVRGPFAQAALYHVTKLADAKRFGTLSRAEFAKKHKLTPVQLEVAHALDSLYEVLAKEFGIDDNRYIIGYMNHYRDYGAGIVTHGADLGFGNTTEQKFLSELTRSGEINDYLRDPISAFEQYVVMGFKAKTKFFEAHAAAQEALDRNIRKLLQNGEVAIARSLKDRVGQYLHEINGRRALDKNTDAEVMTKTVAALNRAFPWLKIDKYFADRLTRAFLSASETAAQGLRPVAGVRDYVGVGMNYAVRFGFERARSALFIGLDDAAVQSLIDAGIIPDGPRTRANPQQALAEAGEIPTLNAMQLIDPAAIPTGVSTRIYGGLEAAAEIGLKGSLQDRAYKRAHAGVYVDTWKRTGDALSAYAGGKIGKEAAYKKIQIDAYDVSIQKHFDGLVEQGKYHDAARFLGRVTAAETVFTYGAAGHPFGWSSNFGRLFGQFGLWGTYQLRYLSRIYSQGTFKGIAARAARFAVILGASQLASKMTGIDFSSWFSTPGTLIPSGGPAFQIAGSLINATSTSEWERQKALAELRRFNPFHQFPSNLGQIYLPFSYAAEDWLRAYDMFYNERFNPVAALGQGAGFKQDLYRDKRSWMDEILGFSPQLKGER